jgi:hypothetical protein
MSELQKKIMRAQRRESAGGLGFGAARREAPKAMVLAAAVRSAGEAEAALAAGADVVILDGLEAAAAAAAMKGLARGSAGARLAKLDSAAAGTLREAGCDFIISPLETTEAAAVDVEKSGQVLEASTDLSDTALRTLGPLGLDGLYVAGPEKGLMQADQLEFARLATLSGSPLLVTIAAAMPAAELRVLRDSGAGAVVPPAGTTADEIRALVEALRAVPPAMRGKREGPEIALVPSMPARANEHEDDDDEDE